MTEINDRSAAEMPAKRKDPAETDKAVAEAIENATKKAATEFDFAAWVKGAKPVTRSVVLYSRPDLLARIDEITELEPHLSRADTKPAREEAKALTAQLLASAIALRIEGKNEWWLDNFRKQLVEEGVTDTVEGSLRQLAAQTVSPEGVTYELLKEFSEVGDRQLAAALNRMREANEQIVPISARFLA